MKKTYPLDFKVVSVSQNTNSFGLHGVVLVARNGRAFEIACSRINVPDRGATIKAELHEETHNLAGIPGISYEIPRKLPAPSKDVIKALFAS